jgi:hypothetical protein
VPLIDAMVAQLAQDVGMRAELSGESPASGRQLLKENAESFKTFLRQRRQFLLAQPELKATDR